MVNVRNICSVCGIDSDYPDSEYLISPAEYPDAITTNNSPQTKATNGNNSTNNGFVNDSHTNSGSNNNSDSGISNGLNGSARNSKEAGVVGIGGAGQTDKAEENGKSYAFGRSFHSSNSNSLPAGTMSINRHFRTEP